MFKTENKEKGEENTMIRTITKWQGKDYKQIKEKRIEGQKGNKVED